MQEEKKYRIVQVAKELSVGYHTLIEHLQKKGITYETTLNPNSKIDQTAYEILLKDFHSDKKAKEQSKNLDVLAKKSREIITTPKPPVSKPITEEKEESVMLIKNLITNNKPLPNSPKEDVVKTESVEENAKIKVLKVVGRIDLDAKKTKAKTEKSEEKPVETEKPIEEQKETKDEVNTTPIEEQIDTVITDEIKIEEIPEAESNNESENAVEEINIIKANAPKLQGLSVKGKIELPEQIVRKKVVNEDIQKKKRKRKHTPEKIDTKSINTQFTKRPETKPDKQFQNIKPKKEDISSKEIQEQMKQTFSKLGSQKGNIQGGKIRQKAKKDKKEKFLSYKEEQEIQKEIESKKIQVTEFVTANELASLMNVKVTEIINTCFSLGMMISINQRLDKEIITLLTENFGYEVNFVSAEEIEDIEEEAKDDEKDLKERPPIVTIMGHVDHGKTSLLDYIRNTNVIAGEAGGITQHVAAYEVSLKGGKKITFIDTPGHEAFTAMRARGAKVTDIVIIVIAADDSVMPQTKEAIAHAQAAGVPIIFAFNKIDKEGANADKVREQLSAMNILVEEWGGKYQTQEISAKKGLNIDLLLEKVLLEAELLELKANPNKRAKGTIMETHVDKGKGVVATLLVQEGTLKVGDFVLAGSNYGRIRALLNERGQRIQKAGPSTPISVLGFQGTPAAGDIFIKYEDEQSAKEIANKRSQLQREQGIRATKHITLEEIGRRLAVGSFKELKLIVKADVDGSVEALCDSLLKLSKDEVQVSVIHKGVGQISESDVLLASASDAIIIGFQVRPAQNAKKIAEEEEIEIKTYSVIYQAIEEVKAAIEGMLSPEIIEEITSNIEVREVFKITKVGIVAGCYVLDGKVERNNKLRIIRDGVVIHDGEIAALKRFKDDVKDVMKGYECGIQVKNYIDIRIGDYFETYKKTEVKRSS